MRELFPNNSFVPPKHPTGKDAHRLLIGEAPGEDEAREGEPFVGGSGRVLNSLLHHAGIKREGLTVANTLCCRPPENFYPTDSKARKYISKEDGERAVAHCYKAYLEPLLNSQHWNRVDLIGDKALKIVAGKQEGVTKWRGSPLKLPNGLDACATFHPSYLMRDQTNFPVAVNDLMKSLEQPPEYYTPYASLDDLAAFKFKSFAFDIETDRWSGDIKCIGLSGRPYFVLCVPFRDPYLSELRRIFLEATELIGHNSIQFDLPRLWSKGIRYSPDTRLWDTMLLHHLCFPQFGKTGDKDDDAKTTTAGHDLEFVGTQLTSKPAWKHEKGSLEYYCCRDVDVTLQAFLQLKELLYKNKLDSLYFDVQVPLAKICYLMHKTGIKVDPAEIGRVREKLLKEKDELEQRLPAPLRTHEIDVNKRQEAPTGTLGKSGKPVKYILVPAKETVVPWRSPAQKQKYLYSKDEPWCLGQDPIIDPKTEKVTTGKIALAKLAARVPQARGALNALAKINQIDELLTTFAAEKLKQVGRQHPHFNPHGTATGRLSSSDPNLQNQPEAARYIYVPSSPENVIVDVDYSQIENRLTAWFANDKERAKRFESIKGFSEHKYAASVFLGIPYDQVEKDNSKDAPYGKAKRIVHGTNYAMGHKKIANLYDMDPRDTKELQDKWKKEIQPTIRWQHVVADSAKKNASLRNPFGRMGFFYTSSAYTESIAFLPQSTAADMIFRAMIAMLYKQIGWPEENARRVAGVVEAVPDEARLLLQVHDSLVFECPRVALRALVAVLRKVMCQSWKQLGGISIPISIQVGDSWGSVEPYVD